MPEGTVTEQIYPPEIGRREPIRNDIRQLTGLRGIAALDVALTHYGMNMIPGARLFAFGNAAVDVFFCLSSFTLCLVYGAGLGRPLHARRFAIARFARIYPLFIVTTLAVLIYGRAWGVEQFPILSPTALLTQFLRQATLLSAMPLPILGKTGSWNVAAWSVSVEALCYVLMFPPLFWLTARARRMDAGSIVLLMLVLGSASFVTYVRFFDPNVNGPFFVHPDTVMAYWVPIIRGFTSFGTGWLAYLLYLDKGDATRFIGSITNALVLVFLGIVAAEWFGLLPSASVVIVAPFIVLGLLDGRTVTARILASPPIHFLGLISYSLYLWHLPMRMILMHFSPWPDNANLLRWMVLPMAVALIASTLSYYGLEMPARTIIRRLLDRAPADPLNTAVPTDSNA
jgi:peptidoglycan/LPS O-acetylase OafA/YrhL